MGQPRFQQTHDARDRQKPRAVPYAATALAVGPVLRSAFRLTIVAPERIPAAGSLVVVANHESNLDGFVLISVLAGRRLTFLSAAHLFERPAIGRYPRAIGALPVEEQRANVASFRRALAILAVGGAVAVFPQGGIGRDEIQGGAAYLTLKANAALLPLRLAGTRKALPPGRGWPSLTRITVRVGVPVPALEMANGSPTTSAAVAGGTRLIRELLVEAAEAAGAGAPWRARPARSQASSVSSPPRS
jgi:1-acyl-sn-glycerol-3-phosphate acyltransferase